MKKDAWEVIVFIAIQGKGKPPGLN